MIKDIKSLLSWKEYPDKKTQFFRKILLKMAEPDAFKRPKASDILEDIEMFEFPSKEETK